MLAQGVHGQGRHVGRRSEARASNSGIPVLSPIREKTVLRPRGTAVPTPICGLLDRPSQHGAESNTASEGHS